MTSISVSSLCNDDIVPYSECLITIPLFSNSLYFITFSLSVALLEQYAIKSLSSVMLFQNIPYSPWALLEYYPPCLPRQTLNNAFHQLLLLLNLKYVLSRF